MAIEFISATTTGGGAGTNVVVAKPSGLVDGCFLLALFQTTTTGATISPPAGWNTRTTGFWRDGTRPHGIFYKGVPDADAEPS